MKKNFTIKQIFADHWHKVLLLGLIIRASVVSNVEKMLSCGDFSKGYALYGCDHCGKFKHVPFRCKSRFCNTCGVKYALDRADAMSLKMIKCVHRHCVFTIPEELRIYFRKDRELLNCLFESVSTTITSWFNEQSLYQNYTPAFICTLHTFGRDLKWNPHLHVILAEGASGNVDVWKNFNHIPFTMLRKRYRTILLNLLEKALNDKGFKKIKSLLYKNYPNGFFVYAARNISKPSQIAKYVGRYTGRPIMAQSRIIDYDGNMVTFWYERHEDGEKVTVTLSAIEFIKKLIIHIPDYHFKMIRYYGLYAKKHHHWNKIIKLIDPCKHKIIQLKALWRMRLLAAFGIDPTWCDCGHFMSLIEIYCNKIPLLEKYRNISPNTG